MKGRTIRKGNQSIEEEREKVPSFVREELRTTDNKANRSGCETSVDPRAVGADRKQLQPVLIRLLLASQHPVIDCFQTRVSSALGSATPARESDIDLMDDTQFKSVSSHESLVSVTND